MKNCKEVVCRALRAEFHPHRNRTFSCVCNRRRKSLRVAPESHSPSATDLRLCARGCGPKPVRFLHSPKSRCGLLGGEVEENGCALNRRESLSSRNWLEVLCLRGADPNLSAFFLSAFGHASWP